MTLCSIFNLIKAHWTMLNKQAPLFTNYCYSYTDLEIMKVWVFGRISRKLNLRHPASFWHKFTFIVIFSSNWTSETESMTQIELTDTFMYLNSCKLRLLWLEENVYCNCNTIFICSIMLKDIKSWMNSVNFKISNNKLRRKYQVGNDNDNMVRYGIWIYGTLSSQRKVDTEATFCYVCSEMFWVTVRVMPSIVQLHTRL